MSVVAPPLTQERLKQVLNYDPETGIFTWREPGPKRVVGGVAGGPNEKGYILICIDYWKYRAHKLAWLYVYGVWPTFRLDHKDTDEANNRIANLRPATNSQNLANRGPQRNNTSGFKGVYWSHVKQKWMAKINKDGRQIMLGGHDTREAAHEAYKRGAEKHFGEFGRAA